MSIDVKSIAILNMPSADYHCIITGISKSEAVNLLKKNNPNHLIPLKIFNDVIEYNAMMLNFIPDHLTPQKIFNEAVEHDPMMLEFIPAHF